MLALLDNSPTLSIDMRQLQLIAAVIVGKHHANYRQHQTTIYCATF